MEQPVLSPEVTFEHHMDTRSFNKRIKKTTIVLSVITIFELMLGLAIYLLHKGEAPNPYFVHFLKGVIIIFTLAKAYYIVSVFMHLGDELRGFIMTIVLPLILFIWFIIAFLVDGNSYRNLRNEFDKYYLESTMPKSHQTPAPAPPQRGLQ